MSEETIMVPLEAELDAFFGQYTAADQARGLVYGLTTTGGLAHWRGFGVANEDGLAPDADTVFPIASMSKSFLAAACLIARDAGRLSLTDAVTTYVPELVLDNDLALDGPPTLEMLLSMCGGLTEDNAWVDPFIDVPIEMLLDQLERGVRLSHYPGATYEYSNLGFALVGLALSRAVERPLADYVHDVLFAPLGLTSTCFDSRVPAGARRATGYSLDAQAHWIPFAVQTSDAFAAAGGIVSTVRDLARWITWLGSAFRRPAAKDVPGILSRPSRRELQRLHILEPPALTVGPAGAVNVVNSGYALGLRVANDFHRGTIISHAGGLPGFKLYMTWHPVTGRGAVVLTNSHRGDPVAICDEALGRALARDEAPASTVAPWPETLALRERVDALICSWDDGVASEILAPNVDFDRPLSERRAEIERLVADVGPLLDPGRRREIVSVVTPADVTWSIPCERGELVCMIHLTALRPAQVQELVVKAFRMDRPRAVRAVDISPRRAWLGDAALSPITNVALVRPT